MASATHASLAVMPSVTAPKYHSRNYLNTIKELKESAVQDFGPINSLPYSELTRKISEVAKRACITNPIMIIDIKFKPGAHPSVKEIPLKIFSEEDFTDVAYEALSSFEYVPHVFLVDGDKFTASC